MCLSKLKILLYNTNLSILHTTYYQVELELAQLALATILYVATIPLSRYIPVHLYSVIIASQLGYYYIWLIA